MPRLLWLALVALAPLLFVVAEERMVMAPEPPRFDLRVEGEVVARPDGPPPLSGGTLLVLPDGRHAVVSDPDRDRLVIADLDDPGETPRTISLAPRSEPGRLAVDAAGRIHAILRGSGGVATLASATATSVEVRDACPMPRGIAYDATSDALVVACRSGELVTLPAGGGDATARTFVDRDLRDVLVEGDHLLVTRFRSAEILVVRGGALTERRTLADVSHAGTAFQNEVAWRLVAMPGGAALVHQRASRAEILPSPGGYGPRFGECAGIVRSALAFVDGRGTTNGPELSVALPIDLAVHASADGTRVESFAIVAGGDEVGGAPVAWIDGELPRDPDLCVRTRWTPRTSIPNPSAVAFTADGRLVVQERNPAALVVVSADGASERAIDLGGDDRFDTGHAIFHAGTASGATCASCHPEGGDDGHVWRFSGLGERRTPALHRVAGTAPFHWSGDLADVSALMNDVFVGRMGGTFVDTPHAQAVESWLGHLPAPREHAGDPAAIARGRTLFEGEAGCVDCHGGALLSDGASHDVGTGGSFQAPSLVGAVDRLPLMHTGCASTMRQRFDPSCGGDRHGPALTEPQIDDLVAYLESI